MANKTAIAYVDGNNLYHGILDRGNCPTKGYERFSKERPWGDLLWLNLESLIECYHLPDIDLIKIKFFQAPSFKPESLTRQQLYHNALMSLDTIDQSSFFFGEFRPYPARCPRCQQEYIHHVEKRTDAAISTEILSDFFLGNCDASIIIGGDADQFPVIERMKSLKPKHKIYAIFPPARKSKHIYEFLGKDYCRNMSYLILLSNQLSDTVTVNGFQIDKPQEYRKPYKGTP
jgi:hypothetical protein